MAKVKEYPGLVFKVVKVMVDVFGGVTASGKLFLEGTPGVGGLCKFGKEHWVGKEFLEEVLAIMCIFTWLRSFSRIFFLTLKFF